MKKKLENFSEIKNKPRDKKRTKINADEFLVSINTKFYPLEAIYGAAYAFIDKAYIFLDGDEENKIDIKIKLKPESTFVFKDVKELKGEFLNELLNFSWRHQISKENKNLREYIVGAALLGVAGEASFYRESSSEIATDPATQLNISGEGEINLTGKGLETSDFIFEDPLGIAVPWEEKFSKKDSEKTVVKTSSQKISNKNCSENKAQNTKNGGCGTPLKKLQNKNCDQKK